MTEQEQQQRNELLDIGSQLKDWEFDFLNDTIKPEFALTPRQRHTLQEIWQRHVGPSTAA
jgi:hypothetical protein